MLKCEAEGLSDQLKWQMRRAEDDANDAINHMSAMRAVQLIAQEMADHRDRFIIIGYMSDLALNVLRHTVYVTNYRKARRQQPTDLCFEVVSAAHLTLPFEASRICVTDVTSSDFRTIVAAIDAWNLAPSCEASPLAPAGTVCDCFVPHHAFEAAIVVADWDCQHEADVACPGWIVIDLSELAQECIQTINSAG